jgi:hypothetical protein
MEFTEQEQAFLAAVKQAAKEGAIEGFLQERKDRIDRFIAAKLARKEAAEARREAVKAEKAKNPRFREDGVLAAFAILGESPQYLRDIYKAVPTRKGDLINFKPLLLQMVDEGLLEIVLGRKPNQQLYKLAPVEKKP